MITRHKDNQKQCNSYKSDKRFLLVQLNSNGDCLYATTVAHQIKVDYPNCHLTWAISSMCRQILNFNPYVDEIWEIPLEKIENLVNIWSAFEQEVWRRKNQGDFDDVYITQFVPQYSENYDGLIRSSIFRGYPKAIRVPVTPILRLSSEEVKNVSDFINQHNIQQKKHVILFECSPKSDQSFVNVDFALEVSKKIINKYNEHHQNVCFILSSNVSIPNIDDNIIDGSILSLRENAELIKYCTLLIGCSSGITWISTSDGSKNIPMVQLLRSQPVWFASVAYDHQHWGLPTNHIIEMTECSSERVVSCVQSIIDNEFEIAKANYNESLMPTFNAYGYILRRFLMRLEFSKAKKIIINHLHMYGIKQLWKWHTKQAVYFLPRLLLKFVNYIKHLVKLYLILG